MNTSNNKNPNLILSVGTRIVTKTATKPIGGGEDCQAGIVGIVVTAPLDNTHAYRVRYANGFEAMIYRADMEILAEYQRNGLSLTQGPLKEYNLLDRVIYRCIVGSRAYGLDNEESDIDRRGIYLPPAEMHWSLYGVPEQLENQATEECYWEIQKFIVLALKANPNILECLYTPLIEEITPLAQELLDMREIFLSKLVYQTFNGYVLSQFQKMNRDLRNKGKVKPKHAMHLIRLLLSGTQVLREGFVPIEVSTFRDKLLAIRDELMDWDEVEEWRKQLHKDFDAAFKSTLLPDRPNYERANDFLIKARKMAAAE